MKPFAIPEFLARIRALLRRGRPGTEPLKLFCGDVEMDLVTRRVRRAGRDADLTAREFELLEYFLRNSDRSLSREELLREVWKEVRRPELVTNAFDASTTSGSGRVVAAKRRLRPYALKQCFVPNIAHQNVLILLAPRSPPFLARVDAALRPGIMSGPSGRIAQLARVPP